MMRKQQQQQQQQASSSRTATPIKSASKTSTPIRLPLVLKRLQKTDAAENENKREEAAAAAAAENRAAMTEGEIENAREEKQNGIEKENDTEVRSPAGTADDNDAERGAAGVGAGASSSAADADANELCSSASTSSFLGWLDSYRVFSLSALYVVVSALFFIWLLYTIFKKSDVSQVSKNLTLHDMTCFMTSMLLSAHSSFLGCSTRSSDSPLFYK